MVKECLLAGDIGGTNTRLQLATRQDGRLHVLAEQRYSSHATPDFESLIERFLADSAPSPSYLRAACFALAGPVKDQTVKPTQLPWPAISAGALSRTFGIRSVVLINDFAAIGHSLSLIRPEETACLQRGTAEPNGVKAVIGAGSGLGQCIVLSEPYGTRVLETEGGHVDFAPADEIELKLWSFLRQSFAHVSYERILSGPGIVKLYQFMVREGRVAHDPAVLADAETAQGPARISGAALAGQDGAAVAALELFARIYGRQAGNWALSSLARGGLYLAGGIAPRILPILERSPFLAAFRGKGRFEPLMRQIPVHVITHPNPGLAGAMKVASELR